MFLELCQVLDDFRGMVLDLQLIELPENILDW
jgi:hypothetical protein